MTSDLNENLNKLRLENTACDVILQIGPKSFLAHRAVLIAQIEYFRKMFTTDMREKKELVIPLDPEIVDSTCFEEILNYIYISKIVFTDENIRPIYRTADYICFDKLTSEVIKHMKSNLNVENVVFYKTFAIEFGLEALEDDCHQFIIQNLSSDINREKLIPILLLEDLNEILQKLKQTGNLEEMFHYSIDWIVHNKDNSKTKLLELLKNIPLENLSLNFLKQVVSKNDLIRKDIECFNLLFDAFITVTESHEKETIEKNELQVEKLNSAIKESDTKLQELNRVHDEKIISVKKESDFRVEQIEKDHTEKLNSAIKESDTKFQELNRVHDEKLNATIKECDFRLKEANRTHIEEINIIIQDYQSQLNNAYEAHAKELNNADEVHAKQLNEITEESDSRRQEINRLNELISKPLLESVYAIGGFNGEALPSVSEYNSRTQKWTATTVMPSKRSYFGCAVIGHKIYICGGYNGQQKTNELIVFDIYTRKWTQLTSMKHEKELCAVAVLNEQIYVAGGRNCNTELAVVERYNVRTDSWEDVALMTIKRNALELVALNGFLYAIGGHDGSNSLNSVERYDPQTDQWTVINNTNNKFNSFGSAVLNGNIYIAKGDKCEVYSLADDRWTEMPALSKCDWGRQLAVYNGKLYAIGGVVGDWKEWKGSKTVEVYDFEERAWKLEPEMKMDVARCYHGLAVVRH